MKHVVFVVSVTLIMMGFAPQSKPGIEYIRELMPDHTEAALRYHSGLLGMTGILIGTLLLLFFWIPSGKDHRR